MHVTERGCGSAIRNRWVEAVDPFNDRERREANDNAFPQYPGTHDLVNAETGNDRPPAAVTVAGQAALFLPEDDNPHFRNRFYWDKEHPALHPELLTHDLGHFARRGGRGVGSEGIEPPTNSV